MWRQTAVGENARITVDGKDLEFPVITGSEGEKGIDIQNLRAKTGVVTLDAAFMNTASTESAVTFLDGEKGILRYRGIPIEELGERSSFVETAYLLIYGNLPNRSELEKFSQQLTRHSMIHEDMRRFFDGYPITAHPMAILSAMVTSLSSYYPYALNAKSDEYRDITIARLMGKLPTIAAFSYKKNIGHPFIYPRNDLEYCANFLHMMFAVPAEPYRPDPVAVRALNLLLILHADHEQNCSTSTVRMVGSAHTNLFASISAGICALWGPLARGRQPGSGRDAGGHPQEGAERPPVHRPDEGQEERDPADGLRAPGLRELRPAGEDHQEGLRRRAPEAGHPRSDARPGQGAGGRRAARPVLRRAQAVPERGLLLGDHLPGAGHPHPDVHGDVRPRPPSGMDRALEGDDRGPEHEDRQASADLHGAHRDPLRADRQARLKLLAGVGGDAPGDGRRPRGGRRTDALGHGRDQEHRGADRGTVQE